MMKTEAQKILFHSNIDMEEISEGWIVVNFDDFNKLIEILKEESIEIENVPLDDIHNTIHYSLSDNSKVIQNGTIFNLI